MTFTPANRCGILNYRNHYRFALIFLLLFRVKTKKQKDPLLKWTNQAIRRFLLQKENKNKLNLPFNEIIDHLGL